MSRAAVLNGRLASDAVLLPGAATLPGFRLRTGVADLAGVIAAAVAFGLSIAVTSAWLALLINDAETAERVLFFPAIA